MATNNDEYSLILEINQTLDKAEQAESKNDWPTASGLYKEALEIIDHFKKTEGERKNELALQADEKGIIAVLRGYYCTLQLTKDVNPEMIEYDSSRRVSKDIKELEIRLQKYVVSKGRLWNILQCMYDKWGGERRDAGMKYEADEFQYHMLRARLRWMWSRITHPNVQEKQRERLEYLIGFVRASVEWVLYRVGKGIFLPFIAFIGLPILICSFVYYFSGCVIVEGMHCQPVGLIGWLYSLSYSIFVFTGSEAGPVTACSGNPLVIFTMGLEAISGMVFIVIVIGYLVNRLASR
jgi:hypothetical protein